MTKDEALKLALGVLKGCLEHPDAQDAIDSIEAALAQRKPLTVHEIGEFVGTHGFDTDQLLWFRLGEAAHGIKGDV